MQYPDLIWTAMGAIGGLLLIDNLPNKKAKVGVWLIFFAFIFQTYWEITHPWVLVNSLPLVILVTVILIVGIPLALRRVLFKKR